MAERTEPSSLPIGLIGCGRIAQRFHLPVLAELPGVTLAAVAEPQASAREACRALSPRVPLVADYRELLERGGIEAVVICLPPALHAEAAIASFERGRHVYLEKPLAASLEDGERVVAAWRRAGTVGRIGFNFRFHPLVGSLRDAVRSGVLGEMVGVRTTFCAARTPPVWKRQRQSGGGVLLDLASHHFDLIRFLLDQEVAEVGALLRSVASEEDTAAIELRLAGGALATVFASLAGAEEDRIEVCGTRGALVLDRGRSSCLRFVPSRRDFRPTARLRAAASALASLPRALRDIALPPAEPSYALALAAFAGAVRGGGPAGPDLADGLSSLTVVVAAERAAASGRTVAVEAVRSALDGALRSGPARGAKP